MKKFLIKKIIALLWLTLFISIYGGIFSVVQAADDQATLAPTTEDEAAKKEEKAKLEKAQEEINEEIKAVRKSALDPAVFNCVTPEAMLKAVVLEEVIDPSAKRPDEPASKDGTYTCFRKTVCLKLLTPEGQVFGKSDQLKDYCFSGLVRECKPSQVQGKPKGVGAGNYTVTCEQVQVIVGAGVTLIEQYVGLIYKWAATMVGIIATLIIIVSGIQIATAGGETGKIDEAKKRIFQSLGGLVLLFLSALILYAINPNFFV